MGNILSQATNMGLENKQVPLEEAQPMIANLLGQNGISSDMITQVIGNVMKDGFQVSDITDVASNMMNQETISKITGGNNDFMTKITEIFGGLFGKK